MAELSIRNLSKIFGTQAALEQINLTIGSGEFFSVLGPSGCGKTTLLRLVGGFEVPTDGEIYLGNRNITKLKPGERNVGMVFQNYALFPHMTVAKNVAFGLEGRGLSKKEIGKSVARVLESVRLKEKAESPVPELSGGEQQRVAVARAIVIEPAVLLFDEPLSNLDVALRASTREEIREIQRRTGITTIYVTHDQSEALGISDRMAVMRSGSVQQIGIPDEIYANPLNPFVARFLGGANLLQGNWDPVKALLDVQGISLELPKEVIGGGKGKYNVAIKPECIRPCSPGTDGCLTAEVLNVEFQGFTTGLLLQMGGIRLRSSGISSGLKTDLHVGQKIPVSIDWSRCNFYEGWE